MISVASTGMTGDAFAERLLEAAHVSVMPSSSFGESSQSWVRIALTVEDKAFDEAVMRISDFSLSYRKAQQNGHSPHPQTKMKPV